MAGITYLHTGGDLNRRSGGGHVFKLCTIFSHTLELLLAFPYDWENETILPGALRHFKRYQTCIVTFCTYYIAWILGDEGRGENGDCSRSLVRTVSTGCETPQCAASWMLLLYARDSSRWLLTPGPHFLSRGAQTFWHRARAYNPYLNIKPKHFLCGSLYIHTFVLKWVQYDLIYPWLRAKL